MLYLPYEIWRDVQGFEGQYQVSNLGNIYDIILNRNKSTHINKGYRRVSLLGKLYFIHRIVLENFSNKIEGKDYVNHKDLDKLNNRIDNLERCTTKENCIHAVYNLCRDVIQTKNGKEISRFLSANEASKYTNFSLKTIRKSLKYKKEVKGYIWFYSERKIGKV